MSVELDLTSGVLTKQDTVTFFDIHRRHATVIELLAIAYGDDSSLLRLLFGCIRDNNSTRCHLFVVEPLDEDTIL